MFPVPSTVILGISAVVIWLTCCVFRVFYNDFYDLHGSSDFQDYLDYSDSYGYYHSESMTIMTIMIIAMFVFRLSSDNHGILLITTSLILVVSCLDVFWLCVCACVCVCENSL